MPWGYTKRPFSSIELACAVRQPGPCVRACCPRTRPARDPDAMQRQALLCVPKLRLHPSGRISTSYFISTQLISSDLFSPKLTSFQLLSSHLLSSQMSPKFFSATFISSEHTLTSLRHMALAATQAGAEQLYFLTARLEQNTPQYYKACTEYFPGLLCTTKLAQSTSQYYFV